MTGFDSCRLVMGLYIACCVLAAFVLHVLCSCAQLACTTLLWLMVALLLAKMCVLEGG